MTAVAVIETAAASKKQTNKQNKCTRNGKLEEKYVHKMSSTASIFHTGKKEEH